MVRRASHLSGKASENRKPQKMPTKTMTNQTTFQETDAFGWSKFSDKLESFLLIERDFVEGSLVVSLNAPFGSGKTTFIQMWKNHLNERRDSGIQAPLFILLNAWEDDYCGDPLLSLVDAIEKELQSREPDKETKQGMVALRDATRDVGWYMLGMANSAVGHWTGLDPVAAGEFAETKKSKRKETPERSDILASFQARKEALGRLKDALRSLFSKNDRPVLILVDELDRCRPDFAVQYLETIKHIFDVDGLVFVLAVDLKQLENSARALFGDGLDFPEYFRKFAHRNIQLPKPDEAGIRNLVAKYTSRYIHDPSEDSPRRKSWMNVQYSTRSLTEMSTVLSLTPRKIQEAFRIVGHLTAAPEGKPQELFYNISASSIFLAFLSLGRLSAFQSIASGKMALRELLELIVELLPGKTNDWWAFVLASKHSSDDEEPEKTSFQAEFARAGIVPKDMSEEDFKTKYRGYQIDPYSGPALHQIALKIQEVGRFAE